MRYCDDENSIWAKHQNDRGDRYEPPKPPACPCCGAEFDDCRLYCDACMDAECGERQVGAACRVEVAS